MESNEMAMQQVGERAVADFSFTNWLIDYIDNH